MLIILSLLFVLFTIVLSMKIGGANSDLFAEGFFFYMLITVNGLFWFILAM
jgi:hypothetical protein